MRVAARDARLAESALAQFRTGPAAISRGELIALAQHLGRLLDVAVGLGERPLAVHHARSGLLAQRLHGLG